MLRILHLSDIHLGKTYKDPESMACNIAADIDHNGLSNIECIVVTGDIFDGQAQLGKDNLPELIHIAAGFFQTLLDEINSNQPETPLCREDVIFVPGNHDIIRTDDVAKRWDKYRDFLKKFYGEIPSWYDLKNYSLCREYKRKKVVFVGFNSCEIEKRKLFDSDYIRTFEKYMGEEKLESVEKQKVIEAMKAVTASSYDDYGRIPVSQLTAMARKIRGMDDYTVVALFHHHFYLFPEIAQRFGDSSLIRNYAEVMQQLSYMHVSVVMHGHKHYALERPFITEGYFESPENIIDVFAGGSVGTDRKDEHTFGVLDLYGKDDDIKLRHYKFCYKDEKLEPIKEKQVPPKKTSGRVVKLLEILEMLRPEKYKTYVTTSEKAFSSYDYCKDIINWVSAAITGFTDAYRYLEHDYHNILFLLYAINYRVISYMKLVGKADSYFESASKNWDAFYTENLENSGFSVSKEEYHQLFMQKRLKDVAAHCDKILNRCGNKPSQVYLAFTMLGIFFSDLYMVLTRYADDFKESIQYKVNIKIEENKFHENVPAPRIVIRSDADRRSAYVELLCNEATAHKMAVLFVKEFDLMIHKFEDYFKLIGLKLYYLLPKIDKDVMKNTLDNYNFEAYIPTLIPLLTGDNIYSSKTAFARELIQNAIDAIAVRAEKDSSEFSKEILIDMNKDEQGRRYFRIVDHGTGMDKYKIERYFTSIGRSFYSGEEYEDLNISYKPISNFGIGFLSSFMVCREIDVRTKYYTDNSEGLKLHIPNYDGCFFIERDEKAEIGTEIKLYLETDIDDTQIMKYIEEAMRDIAYPVELHWKNYKNYSMEMKIESHAMRRAVAAETFKFFVPFYEDGTIGEANYEQDILSGKYVEKYKYGLLLGKNKENVGNSEIFNSGIAVEKVSVASLFHWHSKKHDSGFRDRHLGWNNKIWINFPSSWLQLDVSRENITGFSDVVTKGENQDRVVLDRLGHRIAESMYKQLKQFMEYAEKEDTEVDVRTLYLQDAAEQALMLCGENAGELVDKLRKLQYELVIEFTETGLSYYLEHKNIQNKQRIRFSSDQANAELNKRKNMINSGKDKQNHITKHGKDTVDIWKNRSVMIDYMCYLYSTKEKQEVKQLSDVNFEHRIIERDIFKEKRGNFKIFSTLLLVKDLNAADDALDILKQDNPITASMERWLLKNTSVGKEDETKVVISYEELFRSEEKSLKDKK